MSSALAEALDALVAETADLTDVVVGLDETGWATVTPSEPWTVADQIGHLAYFDEQATLSATDPEAFAEAVNRDTARLASDIADLHRGHVGPLLDWWSAARASMLAAFAGLDPGQRVPWYGPPMRASSAVVARLMETWAHGTDVADSLGAALPSTDRLFLIADLGVRTFAWSYRNNGLTVPETRVRVVMEGPSGQTRTWNDDGHGSVVGGVEDFCLVVAQRRNVEDTGLILDGAEARQWMEIAQVFAGPPGPGRPPS